MINILEIVPTPQAALAAMCDGLERQDKRSKFQIEMDLFLSIRLVSDNMFCCGCAASCAVQQIANKNYTVKFLTDHDEPGNKSAERAIFMDIDPTQLMKFECAIDAARVGDLSELYVFYDLRMPDLFENPYLPLENDNWRERLPGVKKWIENNV